MKLIAWIAGVLLLIGCGEDFGLGPTESGQVSSEVEVVSSSSEKVSSSSEVGPSSEKEIMMSSSQISSSSSEVVTGPKIIAQANFHNLTYEMKGSYSIYIDNGEMYLELSDDFQTSPGPDLFFTLSKSAFQSIDRNDIIGQMIITERVENPSAGQKFKLDISESELKEYSSLVLLCKAFSVLWGSAKLDF